MTSIATFPWRAAHQVMGMERISVGQFALASAPVIGAPIAIAHVLRPLAAYLLTVLERPVPQFMKWPAGTTSFQIKLERHEYVKAGLLSAVMTVAIKAACVYWGVLIASGVVFSVVSTLSLYQGAFLFGAWMSSRQRLSDMRDFYGHVAALITPGQPVEIQILGRTVDLIQAPQH